MPMTRNGAQPHTNNSSAKIRPKTLFTIPPDKMFGEVYICQFPFTSGVKSKIRPALVLFDLHQDAIICRVTSSLQYTGHLDIVLRDWQAAGLLKPSMARLDH